MKVLLSAYQCGPGMGSVSQIGWEWYSRLAERVHVTLATHVRNREALAQSGAPLPHSDIEFIDTEWFAGRLYRVASRLFRNSEHAVFLISSADFFVYDAALLKRMRERRGDWDLIHAVTPVSPVAATRLHRFGIPVILGPWNGGLQSPRNFPEIMTADAGWVYGLRNVGRGLDRLFGSSRKASVILSANRDTDESLGGRGTVRMNENGVDLGRFYPAPKRERLAAEPLRVLFVGRLIPVKGISMLLEAVAGLRGEIPIRVTIVGDGPLRDPIAREVAERGLSGCVCLTGALPLAQVAEQMRNADVFCLPSIRESGGAVLMESLACAVPIIAVRYGGPAEIVDEEVGYPLSVDGKDALVRDLTAALIDLARHPEKGLRKGEAGRRRAQAEYGWDARIDQALELYEQFGKAGAVHV